MRGLRQDLKGGFRLFRREAGFAAVVVVTLAVGTGGATAVYSVLRGVVLSPLPFEDPDRVVMLWGRSSAYPRAPLTVGDHNEMSRNVGALEGVAASWGNTALLLGGARGEQVSVGWVSPEYFAVVGVAPALGRTPQPGEEAAVVLAHDLWVRRYGADPAVVGRTIDLGGDAFEVMGVLPANRDPNLTTFAGGKTEYDVWRLMPADWLRGDDRSVGWLRSTARLREGVSRETAQAEVDALMERVNATVTARDGGTDLRVDLVPVHRDLLGDLGRTLWLLFACVCGVLFVASANVAHLLLARGEARSGEVAVRAALGGSRGRIVRQLLTESAVLATVGGALGLVVAWMGVRGLLAVAPATLPRLEAITMDGSVFLFALGATLSSVLLFGVVPALRSSRLDLARAFADRGASPGTGWHRWSRGLVVAQVALSLALVVGTGLLLRSMAGLGRADLGFEPDGVVTFALEAPDWGGGNAQAAARMRDFAARIADVPGVAAVGFTNRVPLGGGLFTGSYRSEAMAAAEAEGQVASIRYITPGYLEAMGARLTEGRPFDDGDSGAALVDRLVADRLWPDADPVGRLLEITGLGADPEWVEVVGVVAPMKHAGVAQPAAETVFLPMYPRAFQQNVRYAAVNVDGATGPALEAVDEAIRDVDVNAVAARVRPMDDLVAEDVAATRFATRLLVVFGGISLLLATVGLHGVMAVLFRRRQREMGIRMALGAARHRLLRDAFVSGLTLVVAGVLAGGVLALAVGRALGTLLYEVDPSDPTTLTLSVTVILAAGALGAYVPARHVLRVEPATSLREG